MQNLHFGNRIPRLVTVAVAAFLLQWATTGCGNRFGDVIASPAKITQASLALNSGNGGANMNGKSLCVDKPQAKPDYDPYADGSGQYRVCTNPNTSAATLLLGKSHFGEI